MKRTLATSTAIALVGVLGLGSTARADVGDTVRIPGFKGASASARLDSFTDTRATATVWLDVGSSAYCVYVQAAPYAWMAGDGGWKEVPGSRTCTSSTSQYRDRFWAAYSGLKFRICQDIPGKRDKCGEASKIRSW